MILSKSEGKVSSQALILTVSNLIISLIGLVSSMLLSRYRTLDEFGTYSQVIMVTELVSTVLLMGLPQTVNYFLSRAESERERRRFFTLYSLLSSTLCAVIGVCLFFSAPLIVRYFDNPYITTFSYVFVIYPWCGIMLNTLSSVLVVFGNSGRLSLYTLLHSLTTLITVIVSSLLAVDFELYVLVYMLSSVAFATVAFVWCAVRVGGFCSLSRSGGLLREIAVFAIPLGLASSVGTINVQLDKLFIGNLFTTEEYALYTNASRALPVTALATALGAVLLPKLVVLLKAKRNADAVRLWGYAIRVSYVFMCAIVAGLIAFAPDAMSFLYSEKYVTELSVAVFRIYSLTLLFKITYFGIILNSKGRTSLILLCSLISLAANAIGNVVFYHLFGFIGPALSTLFVTLIMNLAQLIATSKITAVPFFRIFPYKSLGVYTIEAIAIGSVFAIIRYTLFSEFSRAVTIPLSIALSALTVACVLIVNAKQIKSNWKNLDSFNEKDVETTVYES